MLELPTEIDDRSTEAAVMIIPVSMLAEIKKPPPRRGLLGFGVA